MPTTRLSFLRMIPVAAVTALLLAGCGGGGGTSSGGSAGAGSSTVTGNVSSFGNFAFNEPAPDFTGAGMLAAIGDFLVARANAQSGEILVTIDGITVPVGADGTFTVNGVESGEQVVVISSGELSCTLTVSVPDDAVVTLTNVTLNEDVCSVERIDVAILDDDDVDDSEEGSEDVSEEDSVSESDDDDGGAGQTKVTLCHKEKNEITVGGPAVDAHIAHGDTEGACGDDDEGEEVADDDSDDDTEDDTDDDDESDTA